MTVEAWHCVVETKMTCEPEGMYGAAACARKYGPLTLRANVASKAGSVVEARSAMARRPALGIRMSILP